MAEQPNNGNTVASIQWDPAVTAFGSIDRLRALVAATSNDDVQVTAVLAVELIGTYLNVSGHLYNQAIDSLGGNKSLRFNNTRLLMGLSWGGVANALRNSSPGVRTFLLIAALKSCTYKEAEIGQTLYDFMDIKGLIHHQPASIQQLQSLVDVLSANCEQLLPSIMATHQEILRVLTEEVMENWTGVYFRILQPKEVAELLSHSFQAIQDSSIDYVELTGVGGLIWIASILLWLNVEDVGLFCWGRCLLGATQAKVRIEVGETDFNVAAQDVNWAIKTWKSGKWIECIIAVEGLERFRYREVGEKIPRIMAQQWYIDRDVMDLKVTLIGGITAALVRSAMKVGHVSRERRDKTHSGKETVTNCSMNYSLLCPEECRLKGGMIVQEFGWDPESIKEHENKFINWASACRDEISKQSVQKYIQREYQRLDQVQDIPEIMEAVSAVTAHAIVAGHLQYGNLVPYFYHYLSSSWIWSLWQKSSGGLPLSTLREQCYWFAGMEHGQPQQEGKALILARNGRVTFPQVCVDYSTVQPGLLELRIIAGHIRYDSSTFTSVVEERGNHYSVPSNTESGTFWTMHVIDADSQGTNWNLRSDVLRTSEISKTSCESSLKYVFANDGSRLLMRTNICSSGHGQRDVNHSETIEELAFAHHIRKAKVLIAESVIAMDLVEAGLAEVAVQPCSEVGEMNNSRHAPRLITTFPLNQETRFFAAHSQFMPRGVTDLYVQQGASLAECIWETLKSGKPKGGNWKIITGHDF